MVFSIGNIFYISLLLVNAIAVLSEERFLARSACLSVVVVRGPDLVSHVFPPVLLVRCAFVAELHCLHCLLSRLVDAAATGGLSRLCTTI